VRCRAAAREYFEVENEEGETERAWPEDLLEAYGPEKPQESLAVRRAGGQGAPPMEPNQALVAANSAFPPAARLRKAGYRLNERILTLTFDFPGVARERCAAQIAGLEAATGWRVELSPEANQSALFALVREVLPSGCEVVKGPALFRQDNQVALTISCPPERKIDAAAAQERFEAESGFALILSFAQAAPGLSPKTDAARPGAPMEINAAYAVIKAGLAGSTLYRTSLKGSEISLSFISTQVAERYQNQIQALAAQVGWPLAINPQPNQGAILETAQLLLSRAGISVQKGPGIYPERGEVVLTAAGPLGTEQEQELRSTFEEQTGYRLVINLPAAALAPQPASASQPDPVISIPLSGIRLRRFQQELALDPAKVEKEIERIRRLGQISPPIQVRRVADGYLLLDGLYRLRAAEALGLSQIPAVIE
jgi:hypothetical protein